VADQSFVDAGERVVREWEEAHPSEAYDLPDDVRADLVARIDEALTGAFYQGADAGQ
jgi:hypothetical protein